MKDPQAAIGPTLDPGFLVRSPMYRNRPGRNTDGEVETGAARFLGIARFAVPSVATATGAVFCCVTEVEEVAVLLAHDVPLLIRVFPICRVAIIHLRGALVDVSVWIEADRSQAEPPIVAVSRVTDAYLTNLHFALFACTA